MEDATRRAVLEGLARRLRALTTDQLVDRPPVFSILARKPQGAGPAESAADDDATARQA